MPTSQAFNEAVDRLVERAGGNDELLQSVAQAFGSNDPARVQKVVAEQTGQQISEAEAREYMQQFQAQYQADPGTGRYYT